MSPAEQHIPGNSRSFAQQFVSELRDSRLWIIVLPSLLLSGLVISFIGPRLAAVLTLAIGLIASHLLNRIEKLPIPGGLSTRGSFYQRILIPALVGIFIVPGSEILARLWLAPWYWFHASSEVPSCWFLMCGAAWGWFGILVCGSLIALLTGRRATFAAMVGVAVYLPLGLTDIYTGTLSQKTIALLASSCKFLSDGTDVPDFEALRQGMAFGLVVRAFLVVFTARVVSSWRASRETSASDS